MTTRGTLGAVLLVALVAACVPVTGPTDEATPLGTAPPLVVVSGVPTDPTSIVGAITGAGLRDDLDALAAVSSASLGYRALGAGGYETAADLVADELRALGWRVHDDPFTTPLFSDPGDAELVVGDRTFGAADIRPLIFAPGGEVQGPVVALDWDGTATEPTGPGCSVADYGALPTDAIVLVRPGPCRRRDAIIAAQQAGGVGFVAGYPWAETDAVLRPTLIEPDGIMIPAVGASRTVGDELAAAAKGNTSVRLTSHAETVDGPTRSIIAELPGTDTDTVVMLGAHLDSVIDGPGINDNGSGVAALLAIARALDGRRPRSTIRLGFWAAEEVGLHGSAHYVDGLSGSERAAIVAYLNADMVASPNGYAGVYREPGAQPGSAALSDLLWAAVQRAGATPVAVDIGGGSDHATFGRAGIVTGGVFSGANEIVSTDQAASSDAVAGQPADACYHQACDDGSKLDLDLARRLTAALADVAVSLAEDPTQID
jgi:Peptidase family M28/PA domain